MTRISLSLTILSLLLTTIGCEHKTTYLLPNDLVGFWTADEPRYEGRFLELYRAYVIIGTGSTEVPKVQGVNSVEAVPEGDHIAYHVLSTDLAGVQYKMTLFYTPARGGEIRFKHMENITWKRQTDNNGPAAVVPQKTPSPTPQPKARKGAG